MLSDIINIHLHNHPEGLTTAEVSEDVWISLDVCRATLSQMEKSGQCFSDGKRPKRYKSGRSDFDQNVYDEYIHRVIAREEITTIDDVVSITYLTKYKISLSLKRLKNLGKISTMTGNGIKVESLPTHVTRRPWTTTDIKWLKESAGKIPMQEIRNHLGRSERSVAMMLMRMGLSSVTRNCRSGHAMVLRKSGKWVCNVCHREYERKRR